MRFVFRDLFDGDSAALGRLLKGRAALITPHVAEFARLAKMEVKEVLENRFDVATEMARDLGATVLLKGSPTVIFRDLSLSRSRNSSLTLSARNRREPAQQTCP